MRPLILLTTVATAVALTVSCGVKKCTSNADCWDTTGVCNLQTGLCGGEPTGGGSAAIETGGGSGTFPRGGGSAGAGGTGLGGGTGQGGGAAEVCSRDTCNGCCQNGVCQSGSQQSSCGYDGAACVRCPTGSACQDGACIANPPEDGLPGSECLDALDCLSADGVTRGNGVFCAPPQLPDGGPSPFPGGGCLALCSGGASDCQAAAATCVVYQFTSGCAPNCMGVGAQGSCRVGYVCNEHRDAFDLVTPWGVCLPDCRVQGVTCTPPQTCSAQGVCQAP